MQATAPHQEESVLSIGDPQPTDEQYRVCLARSAGHFSELTPFVTWFAALSFRLGRDPRIKDVIYQQPNSPRILLNRNLIVKSALESKCDFLLMVDPDMQPDFLANELGAIDFWKSSFEFMLRNRGCVIGAPACSGYPKRDPCVWRLDPEMDKVVRVTREEAGRQRPCLEQVSAIGTGLMLIDMQIFDKLEQPWFDDVYLDKSKTRLTMSQDVWFCRQVNKAEFPVFCNWSAWAAHWKYEPVCRPEIDTEITIGRR